MDFHETATTLCAELIQKSGVREWDDPVAAERIALTAGLMAEVIHQGTGTLMALPDYFKVEPGTALTFKASGGSAAITLTSLANNAARQSATLDLGANWAQWWRMDADYEIAATPTAGKVINHYASFENATGAGRAGTSGSNAVYTGINSNLAASLKLLQFIGPHICTADATATIQDSTVATFRPLGRYMNLVVENQSGAALHSSATNIVITITPLEELVQDAV